MGEVIISQYIEGSKLNKAVVVTNKGTTPADLSDYELKLSVNSRPWSEAVKPLGRVVLNPGESYAVCNTKFGDDSEELAKHLCDAFDGAITFNGNDAVGLFRDGRLVDTFGKENGEGLDSAGGYTVAGVPAASRNHTVVRNGSVTEGETNWEVSAKDQWTVLPIDTFVKNIRVSAPVPGSTDSPPGPKPTDDVDAPGTPVGEDATQPTEVPEIFEPLAPAPGVRMATFNTLFLFDGISDPRPSPYRGKPEEAEKHFVRVASLVKSLRVDLMNLCEVEDERMLERMAEAVGGGMGHHFVEGTDNATGQDVGLLAQATPSEIYRSEERVTAPLPGSVCGSDRSKNTGVSKHYVAKFDAQKYFPFKFAMVGIHLKAFPTQPKSCNQREGQAEVIRRIIVDLINDGYEVSVLGDVNDYSDKTKDKIDNTPTSRVLAMLRDPFNKGEDDLRNVADVIPKEDRYTAWWDRNKDGDVDRPRELTQIDHILLTKGLWDLMDRAWVDHRMDPTVVSDHWPLIVDFKALQ